MPGLVPGIHVLAEEKEVVDGRDKPGHDGDRWALPTIAFRSNRSHRLGSKQKASLDP
jgi:hypothetical protein